MEDIAGKIAALLDSPDGLDTIRSLAGSLLGEMDNGASAAPNLSPEKASGANVLSESSLGGLSSLLSAASPDQGGLSSLLSSVTPDQIGMIMKVMTALNSNKQDNRSSLLMALRPHLSESRQERVDRAIKLLRLTSLLPLVSEIDLFKL